MRMLLLATALGCAIIAWSGTLFGQHVGQHESHTPKVHPIELNADMPPQ